MVLLDIPLNLLLQAIALFFLAYSTILSSYNFFFKNKPKIRVFFDFGFPAGRFAGSPCYVLTATNIGNVPTTLNGLNILVPGKSRGDALKLSLPRYLLILLLKIRLLRPEGGIQVPVLVGIPHESDVTFPYTIEPGKTCNVWVPAEELALLLTDKNRGLRDLITLSGLRLEDSVYSGAIKVKCEYTDVAKRSYKSRCYNIDLDKWMRLSSKGRAEKPPS
ncbi:MAG: hypothetical protein WAN56_09155 [Halobacteriota archaeon]